MHRCTDPPNTRGSSLNTCSWRHAFILPSDFISKTQRVSLWQPKYVQLLWIFYLCARRFLKKNKSESIWHEKCQGVHAHTHTIIPFERAHHLFTCVTKRGQLWNPPTTASWKSFKLLNKTSKHTSSGEPRRHVHVCFHSPGPC